MTHLSSSEGRRSGGPPSDNELSRRICDALRALLDEQSFDEITVAAIIGRAEVSRASFYFYFPSKQEVLHALVGKAVAGGHRAAQNWVASTTEPVAALRQGAIAGAQVWRDNAGVLTAVVDTMGTNEAIRQMWIAQMNTYTSAAIATIAADPAARKHLAGHDTNAIASALTWMGERLYYLAARGIAPFDDEAVLIDTITHAWVALIYGRVDGAVDPLPDEASHR